MSGIPLPAGTAASTPTQGDLLDAIYTGYPPAFWTWLDDNWHVYRAVVNTAREARRRGITRWSVCAIVEVLRWESAVRQNAPGVHLKINNNARPWLARLIMAREPDLAGFFETRDGAEARRDAVRLDGTRYAEGVRP